MQHVLSISAFDVHIDTGIFLNYGNCMMWASNDAILNPHICTIYNMDTWQALKQFRQDIIFLVN